MAYMVGQTVRNGRRAGFSAMFGIISGTFVHIAMAAVGLSAVIATSAAAFSVVKWLGVAYLVWLGIKLLRSAPSGGLNAVDTERDVTARNVFGHAAASMPRGSMMFFMVIALCLLGERFVQLEAFRRQPIPPQGIARIAGRVPH